MDELPAEVKELWEEAGASCGIQKMSDPGDGCVTSPATQAMDVSRHRCNVSFLSASLRRCNFHFSLQACKKGRGYKRDMMTLLISRVMRRVDDGKTEMVPKESCVIAR